MQSVFKLELAVTVLRLVEQGRFDLDQPIHFLPSDRNPADDGTRDQISARIA